MLPPARGSSGGAASAVSRGWTHTVLWRRGGLFLLLLLEGAQCLANPSNAPGINNNNRPNVNVFMSEEEVKKLLGLDAELYYVRDDVVNHYALSFILPVPSDTNSLHFTWHSSSKVEYRLGFQVENTSAMDQPQSNISAQGEVPRTRSVFRVDLFCSGKADGEAVLTVQLNLTTPANNFTVLNFKRRKMCYRRIEQPEPPKFPNTSTQTIGPSSSNAPTTSTRVFYISVCVCCIVIFLVAIILAVLHLHSMKRVEMDDSVSDSGSSQGLSQPSTQTTQYLRADTPNNATPVTSKTMTTPRLSPLTSDQQLSQTSQPSAVTICTPLPYLKRQKPVSLAGEVAQRVDKHQQGALLPTAKFHTSGCISSCLVHTKCAFLYK